MGVGLGLLGLVLMMGSPYLRSDQLNLSVGLGLVSFAIVFLLGFAALLVGVGLVLVENNLWGELRR